MVKATALYGHPEDPDAFDEYYAKTHVPLVEKIPNLQRGSRRPRSSPLPMVASCPIT
jgi:uncharacterized protein (TIGR02118 family)